MTADHFELGVRPPLGEVPDRMYASVIRPERYGPPEKAFATELVDVPQVGHGQVLVYMMAAGINYNNVWSSLGYPVDVVAARQKEGAAEDFHIGGSEGSGIVWAVGPGVSSVSVGDEVVLSSGVWDEGADDVRMGFDGNASTTMRAWGYETNFGSFAQFALVKDLQCHRKPAALSWEEAASFLLTGPTAYNQLTGWAPHTVEPGDPVLIWGGAGGLGSMAIQIARQRGGIPIAVVSDDDRGKRCIDLGAKGYINRTEFDHWGRLPDIRDAKAMADWTRGARAFGKKFWDVLGERRAPRVVLEHTGQDTIPTSMYLCDTAGMVVICGGTTGYNADVDLRYLWMRQKRLQGSHYANLRQCRQVIQLAADGLLDPCLSWTGNFDDIGLAHQMLYENKHPYGNMAVRINAPAEQ
ncbi:crotonyl-CoA carboxylase/reductase [Saccharothrix sp. NRRL B-16314]|uniref:crotonyl-CoA carboxylase/reductase n=1 Tax=Saccharothrix sp. NRRL B-16314 TaxID=1463825 RepID=UPI000A47EB03|nr:crotonyl-CoA carboxylase/reductase [Saccharothrix sp. NRRL B-16314]